MLVSVAKAHHIFISYYDKKYNRNHGGIYVKGSPTQLEYVELAEFRYRLRKFLHFSEQAAREVGITPNQHQLLLVIQGYTQRTFMTPTEIAERLQIRHHSCLGLIQRCEHLGLVQRFDNPDDRRSVFIQLTEYGTGILDKLTMLHQAELRRLGLSHRNFMKKDFSSLDIPTVD